MSGVDGDEPAFPAAGDVLYHGLTARAYFASRAMQGLCSGPQWPDRRDSAEIARRAVVMADDLIAALNTPPDRDTHEPFR